MFYHLKKKRMDPPGGWYFVTDDNFFIKAGNFDKLVTQVKRHFDVNSQEIPVDVATLIEDQICRRIPASLVLEDIFNRFPTDGEIDKSTRKVVTKLRQEGMVADDTATSRQESCKNCRYNSWRHGCFSCSVASRLTAFTLRGRPESTRIKACDITHSLCNPMSFMQEKVSVELFGKIPIDEYPERCWLRKLLEKNNGE